jgi:hypothetical protein
MEEKRPLRRQANDHHFWSLIMLGVTAAAFLLVVWLATKALFVDLRTIPTRGGEDPGFSATYGSFTTIFWVETPMPLRRDRLRI